jgi:hypothetical protein
MEHTPEQESAAVRGALADGRLTVPDPETGFHHPMYATCPSDGAHAQVRRVVRGSRGAIIQVTARCPQCGTEFTAAPEELHLR